MTAPKIVSIQSEVVYGHVGQGAARFALQRMGFEVLALPTVIYSNHPGHRGMRGETVSPQLLNALIDGLEERGFLTGCAGVISGYLGAPEQAAIAAGLVARVKAQNPQAIYLCDPVFGDDDGAYAKPGVAEAKARTLIPLADIVTPNRFELASLTAQQIASESEAIRAARTLGRPEVVATSIPAPNGQIATICALREGAWSARTERLKDPPHGAGDLYAALYLGHRLRGLSPDMALGRAGQSVHAVLTASIAAGLKELALIENQDALLAGDSLPLVRYD
jgi:pyridoxine kinase